MGCFRLYYYRRLELVLEEVKLSLCLTTVEAQLAQQTLFLPEAEAESALQYLAKSASVAILIILHAILGLTACFRRSWPFQQFGQMYMAPVFLRFSK